MINFLLFLLFLNSVLPTVAYKTTLLPKHHLQFAFNKPSAFGKTHFIIGYQENKQKNVTQLSSTIKEKEDKGGEGDFQCNVFFAPDDDINKQLLSLIEQEKKYIRIAVFHFTNRSLAQALINAKKKGIEVEIITDINGIYDRYSKIDQLYNNNIPVLIFDPKKNKAGGLMHHKFALFSNNGTGNSYVWTGSCNFTRAGCQINQENGLLLNDQTIVNKFLQQFERVKEQSREYKPLIKDK